MVVKCRTFVLITVLLLSVTVKEPFLASELDADSIQNEEIVDRQGETEASNSENSAANNNVMQEVSQSQESEATRHEDSSTSNNWEEKSEESPQDNHKESTEEAIELLSNSTEIAVNNSSMNTNETVTATTEAEAAKNSTTETTKVNCVPRNVTENEVRGKKYHYVYARLSTPHY